MEATLSAAAEVKEGAADVYGDLAPPSSASKSSSSSKKAGPSAAPAKKAKLTAAALRTLDLKTADQWLPPHSCRLYEYPNPARIRAFYRSASGVRKTHGSEIKTRPVPEVLQELLKWLWAEFLSEHPGTCPHKEFVIA